MSHIDIFNRINRKKENTFYKCDCCNKIFNGSPWSTATPLEQYISRNSPSFLLLDHSGYERCPNCDMGVLKPIKESKINESSNANTENQFNEEKPNLQQPTIKKEAKKKKGIHLFDIIRYGFGAILVISSLMMASVAIMDSSGFGSVFAIIGVFLGFIFLFSILRAGSD